VISGFFYYVVFVFGIDQRIKLKADLAPGLLEGKMEMIGGEF